jgi:hypothetical protein
MPGRPTTSNWSSNISQDNYTEQKVDPGVRTQSSPPDTVSKNQGSFESISSSQSLGKELKRIVLELTFLSNFLSKRYHKRYCMEWSNSKCFEPF